MVPIDQDRIHINKPVRFILYLPVILLFALNSALITGSSFYPGGLQHALPGDSLAPSGAWRITTVPGDTNQGTFTSIAVDQGGKPHISFMDVTGKAVKYTQWDGSAWQTVTLDVLANYLFPATSLALDGSGRPHVVYTFNNPVRVGLMEWDGAQWLGTLIDVTGSLFYVDLALKDDGEPCVSYYVTRTGTTLVKNIEVRCRAAGAWPTSTTLTAREVNYNSSIFPTPLVHSLALDSQDSPYFSFMRYTAYPGSSYYELNYRDHSDNIYGNLVDGSQESGYYSSLAMDSLDRPHISYYDKTNGDLKYASWNSSAWVLETVDSSGIVGSYTSLALAANDHPHISYYDETSQHLKHAAWDGSQWQIETVDPAANVGRYSSLALDGEGNIHISYYDAASQKLKYATNAAGVERKVFLPLVTR